MTSDEKFQAYHESNPQVFEAFVRYTSQLVMAGRTRAGAKAIMERIRWDSIIGGDDEFKVNNNYTARFVRLLIKQRPHLAYLFSTRSLKA